MQGNLITGRGTAQLGRIQLTSAPSIRLGDLGIMFREKRCWYNWRKERCDTDGPSGTGRIFDVLSTVAVSAIICPIRT